MRVRLLSLVASRHLPPGAQRLFPLQTGHGRLRQLAAESVVLRQLFLDQFLLAQTSASMELRTTCPISHTSPLRAAASSPSRRALPGRQVWGEREAQPAFSGEDLTLAAWTSLRVPERVMRRVSDRAPSPSRSHSTLAPVVRQMARTVSPPFPGGGGRAKEEGKKWWALRAWLFLCRTFRNLTREHHQGQKGAGFARTRAYGVLADVSRPN